MKTNWYMVFLYFIGMSIVGFFLFDNIVSSLIFGISGAVMGWIFNTNKVPKKCKEHVE